MNGNIHKFTFYLADIAKDLLKMCATFQLKHNFCLL